MYVFRNILLFVLACIVSVSCTTPKGTTNPSQADAECQEMQNSIADQMDDKRTIDLDTMPNTDSLLHLLVEKNYQAALDVLPHAEKELLAKDSSGDVARYIEGVYCFLLMTLERNEEALQKMREYKLPDDTDRELMPYIIHNRHLMKVVILSRLGMVNDIIADASAILENPDVEPVLRSEPSLYIFLITDLIRAEVKKGDFNSARSNINKCCDYIKELPRTANWTEELNNVIHESFGRYEYYMDHQTKTHTVRYKISIPEPPKSSSDDPLDLEFKFYSYHIEIVSKADGSVFTSDDYRKAMQKLTLDPAWDQPTDGMAPLPPEGKSEKERVTPGDPWEKVEKASKSHERGAQAK